ncbi:hypothetical protein FH972_012031 [Carpinus fangiana]|uniref:DUF4408 domain-containing protein n=1 Tax=Carpinus fangiana TaxID=176857 RepID=A0A5N6R2K2_9ROSI|nr:hypothetical protein FH972_012031 [Carpinus fangiana]
MRFVKILIPLVLCLAAIGVLSLWLSNREHKLHGFSSSPLLLFSVLNTIVIAILVLSYGPYSEEDDRNWPILPPPYEGDAKWPILPPLYERDGKGDTGDYIEDEEEYNGSDGYEEDNDDDSSDDEEYENLEMRIESFIAKVYEQRRKESLLESRGTQL